MALAEAVVELTLDTSQVEDQLKDLLGDIEKVGDDIAEVLENAFRSIDIELDPNEVDDITEAVEQGFEDAEPEFNERGLSRAVDGAIDFLNRILASTPVQILAELDAQELQDDALGVLSDVAEQLIGFDFQAPLRLIIDEAGLVENVTDAANLADRVLDAADVDLTPELNFAQFLIKVQGAIKTTNNILRLRKNLIELSVSREKIEEDLRAVTERFRTGGQEAGEALTEAVEDALEDGSAEISEALDIGAINAGFETAGEQGGEILGRVAGVQISDQLTNAMKDTKLQEAIRDPLERVFDGAGAEAAKGFSDEAVEKIESSFDSLQERLAGEGEPTGRAFGSRFLVGARAALANPVGALLALTAGTVAVGQILGRQFGQSFTAGFENIELREAIDRNLVAIIGDAAQASAVSGELVGLANRTSFLTSEIVTLGASLTAVAPLINLPFEDVDDALGRVVDAVQFAGGGFTEAQGVIRGLTKAASQGRVSLEAYESITNNTGAAGALLTQRLDEQFAAFGGFRQAVIEGVVTAEDLLTGLRELPETFGASADAAATFTGRISTLQGVMDTAVGDAVRPLNDALVGLFDDAFVGDLVTIVADSFSVLTDLFAGLVPLVAPLVDIFASVASAVTALVGPVFRVLGAVLSSVLVPAFSAAAKAMEPMVAVLKLIGAGFGLVVDAIEFAIRKIREFLGPILEPLGRVFDFLTRQVDGATMAVDGWGDALEESGDAAADAGGEARETVNIFGDLDDAALGAAGGVGALGESLQLVSSADQLRPFIAGLEELSASEFDIRFNAIVAGIDFNDGRIQDNLDDSFEGLTELRLFANDRITRIKELNETLADGETSLRDYDAAALELEQTLNDPVTIRLFENLPDNREELELFFNELGFPAGSLDPFLDDILSVQQDVKDRVGAAQAQFYEDLIVRERAEHESYLAARNTLADSEADRFRDRFAVPDIGPTSFDDALPRIDAPAFTGQTEIVVQALAAIEEGSAGLSEELDFTLDRLNRLLGDLPSGYEGLVEDLLEITEDIGDRSVEEVAEIADALSGTLSEGLLLTPQEQAEIARVYRDSGEDAALEYVGELARTVQAQDRASVFELGGLGDATDLAIDDLREVQRIARASGVPSGANLFANRTYTFNNTINVTALQQSLQRLDEQVRATQSGQRATQSRNSFQ